MHRVRGVPRARRRRHRARRRGGGVGSRAAHNRNRRRRRIPRAPLLLRRGRVHPSRGTARNLVGRAPGQRGDPGGADHSGVGGQPSRRGVHPHGGGDVPR